MRQWILRRLLPGVAGLLGILPALCTLQADEPTYLLVYKFQADQTVYYEVKHEMMVHTQLGEASETVTNSSTTRKHFRVASVDSEGVAVLDPVIDRVQMSARFGDNESIDWDSTANSPPPPQFQRVAETIGKPLARIKVAANGKLLWVLRLDPTRRPADATRRTGSDVPDDDPSRNFLVVFPEKPIHIGDSWEDTASVKVAVGRKRHRTIKLRRRYTLKSVTEHVANISVQTTVLTPVNNPEVRAQLIQRTPSGTIVFDLQRGLIVSRELKIDKEEVGIADGRGLMHAKSEHKERLFDPEHIARKPAGPPPGADATVRE